jgi:hypothetical protein
MLDCSSGTSWPVCKQVCPSWKYDHLS